MSKYTTEVRYVCEMKAGYFQSQGYNAVDEVIDKSWEKIFSVAGLGEKYSWPIFDENYRSVLCKKILKHFYTREICAETVGLWQLWLNQRLDDIMPYYNKLYESELLEYNWMYDTDYYTEGERQGTEDETTDKDYTSNYTRTDDLKETTDKEYKSDYTRTDNLNEKTETNISDKTTNDKDWTEKGDGSEHIDNTSTTDSSYTDWDLYSDTPQGGIEGITGETGDTVNNNFYLTNARKRTEVATSTTEGTEERETDYEKEGTEDTTENYTRDLNSNVDNTGTQNNAGTENTDSTVTNTGTQNNDGTETTDTTRDLDTTENYLEHVYGKRNSSKSYMELLLELRETFINIDLMIINELNDLFFALW